MSLWSIFLTLTGLNRSGQILYKALFVLAVLAMVLWFVEVPRLRFLEEDERLFRAARHGDLRGVEDALAAGARLDVAAPIDGKTALFRAAVFGHADLVRELLKRGADVSVRGNDGRTVLEVVQDARAGERDGVRAQALDRVIAVLRGERTEP